MRPLTARFRLAIAAISVVVMTLTAPTRLAAQATPLPNGSLGQTPEQLAELQAQRVELANAKALAKIGDASGAEQALGRLNRSKPNSGEWHLEISQRLVQFSQASTREGQREATKDLLASALAHLAQADLLLTDPARRASAKAFLAFVQERFLGNHKEALAAHRAAFELSPETSPKSKEAIDRLEQSSALEGTETAKEG